MSTQCIPEVFLLSVVRSMLSLFLDSVALAQVWFVEHVFVFTELYPVEHLTSIRIISMQHVSVHARILCASGSMKSQVLVWCCVCASSPETQLNPAIFTMTAYLAICPWRRSRVILSRCTARSRLWSGPILYDLTVWLTLVIMHVSCL